VPFLCGGIIEFYKVPASVTLFTTISRGLFSLTVQFVYTRSMIYKKLCTSNSIFINIVFKVKFNASAMLLLCGNKWEMNAITSFTPFSLTVGTSVYTVAKIHQIIRPSLMIINLCATEPESAAPTLAY
jgi:uncharacterized membrane protein